MAVAALTADNTSEGESIAAGPGLLDEAPLFLYSSYDLTVAVVNSKNGTTILHENCTWSELASAVIPLDNNFFLLLGNVPAVDHTNIVSLTM